MKTVLNWDETSPGEWLTIINGSNKDNALAWAEVVVGDDGYIVEVSVSGKVYVSPDSPRTLVVAQAHAERWLERGLIETRRLIDEILGDRTCDT